MADDFTIQGGIIIRAVELPGTKKAQVLFVAPKLWTSAGPVERLSVGVGAVVALAPPAGTTHVLIQVDPYSNPIRWYDDGSDPTTGGVGGHGFVLDLGESMLIDIDILTNFKMISVVGTAIVNVSYKKVL